MTDPSPGPYPPPRQNDRNHHHRDDADHVVTGLDGLVELLGTKFQPAA